MFARFFPIVIFASCALAAGLAAAEARVALELVTEGGFPLGGERRWIRALEKVGTLRHAGDAIFVD